MIETKSEVIAKKMEHIDSLQNHFQESNVARKEARMEVVRLKNELRQATAKLKSKSAQERPALNQSPIGSPAPGIKPAIEKPAIEPEVAQPIADSPVNKAA